jgi:chromosome segregation ATPase
MLKMEGARIERQRISNVKKCDAMQETLDALEQERENLRIKILILEKDLEKAQKKLEQSKREVEDLDKQRTAVNRNLQRAGVMTGEHENQMKINAIAINNLDGELEGFKREIVFQTDTVHRLERERDFYSHEATKLAHLVASRVDYIKRLDMSILEAKRGVAELEYTFKSHQQSYESVIVEKMYNERILRDAVVSFYLFFINQLVLL